MLRLTTRRREVLLEKGPDMANLAMGGLVFGQFLSPELFSLPLALGGLGVWIAVMGLAIGGGAAVTNVFVMLGGIVLFMAIIFLLDWIGRRKDAESHHRPLR